MNRTNAILLSIALSAFVYWFLSRPEPAEVKSPAAPPRAVTPAPKPANRTTPLPVALPPPQPRAARVIKDKTESQQLALRYKIQNGLFIVQGDVLAGTVPKGEEPPEDGLVAMEPLKLWPSSVIPYHIQPDVPNPERIEQAIRMFDGTNVRFIKYESGEDALVFDNGETNCLSYVGKVTAKQPIFLSPNCQPSDIAHEILHALGFIHEQNRSDRDDFLEVRIENVEETQKSNFEKLPPEYMKVSGLAEFDFQSLMLYPPEMFAKPGQITMEAKSRDRLIDPQPRLSRGDLDRLNRAYANR